MIARKSPRSLCWSIGGSGTLVAQLLVHTCNQLAQSVDQWMSVSKKMLMRQISSLLLCFSSYSMPNCSMYVISLLHSPANIIDGTEDAFLHQITEGHILHLHDILSPNNVINELLVMLLQDVRCLTCWPTATRTANLRRNCDLFVSAHRNAFKLWEAFVLTVKTAAFHGNALALEAPWGAWLQSSIAKPRTDSLTHAEALP